MCARSLSSSILGFPLFSFFTRSKMVSSFFIFPSILALAHVLYLIARFWFNFFFFVFSLWFYYLIWNHRRDWNARGFCVRYLLYFFIHFCFCIDSIKLEEDTVRRFSSSWQSLEPRISSSLCTIIIVIWLLIVWHYDI